MFLTWRLIAVSLCFVWSGNRWLAGVPALTMFALGPVGAILSSLANHAEYWSLFVRIVPSLLACLVAVKFLLAFLALRISLKRRLLAPSALLGYLAVWILLVAALLTTVVILSRLDKVVLPLLPVSLGIVLLVPLARIGLCPIALARNRHT